MSSHILVIEDDDSLRSVIASTLTRLGYLVRTAQSGAHGLALFAIEPAALVITDVFMPEVDGLETIQELRKAPCPPKIIAISGGGVVRDLDILRAAKLLGADLVMSKPFSISALIQAASALLDAHAADLAQREQVRIARPG